MCVRRVAGEQAGLGRTLGPGYWAPENVMLPKFIITIDHGGDVLLGDTNDWGPALESNQQGRETSWRSSRIRRVVAARFQRAG